MPPGLALIGIAIAGALAAPRGAAWPAPDEAPARALGARDDGERLRAVLELAREDAPRATALLVPMLADRDPNVRLAAARLLARRGAREATSAAVAWLATNAPRERFLGLLVLRQVAELSPEARRAAERALRDGDLQARLEALDVLTAFPAASSLAAVAGALDDELAEVRVRAVRALAAMHEARATLPLLGHVADGDRGVREATLAALGALGDRRALPALLRQLADGAPEPRANGVDALARLGDAAAVPALAALARRRPRDELARHAALALGALGTAEAVDALLALAREPPGADDLRVALERAGAPAVPRLCRELTTGTPTSARLAALALGALGDRRATNALVRAARARAGTALVALEALARLADPAAVPALVELVDGDVAADLRGLALDALVAIGDGRALEAVPRALGDATPSVRMRGVRLAGALGGPAEAPALAARLADPSADVRRAAALALARLRAPPPEIAPPILAALGPAAPALDAAEARALGDALERIAPERGAVGAAYLSTTAPLARAALARGLAACRKTATARAPASRAVVSALLRDLGAEPALATAAAEALAPLEPTRDEQPALLAAFARAEPEVAARLAPALAGSSPGVEALEHALADETGPPSLRAAAAWALAGVSSARPALRRAADGAEPRVAANARAALARPARDAARASVRLTADDGAPWPGRWVTFASAAGAPVWALTDLDGRASVAGLPEGPIALSVPRE